MRPHVLSVQICTVSIIDRSYNRFKRKIQCGLTALKNEERNNQMDEIPKINYEKHNGRSYINSENYSLSNILDCVKDRKRFAEIRSIIEKIQSSNSPDFTNYFNNHFLINSANHNDALIAILALYSTLLNKHGESEEWQECYDFEEFKYLIENDPRASVTTFNGFPNDAFFDTGNKPDDELSEQLDNSKVHIVEIISSYDFINLADEIEKYDGFVFVVCRPEFSFYDCLNSLDESNSESNKDLFESKSIELGYLYLKIGTDTVESLQQMMLEKFKRMGFDVSHCKNELKSYCALLKHPDEYHLNIFVQSILNQWLFSGNDKKVITKSCVSKLLNCKSHTVGPKALSASNTQRIVGLESEQEKINGIVKMLVLEKKRREMGIASAFNGCNCCFAGAPGTAKTTLARMFTKQLADNHIISSANNFKECRKSDITGMYVGWTAAKIDKMFSEMDEAGGGVIFFDEIYTLSEDNATSYDTEAITCIVQNMENYRSTVFCIFAGYENKMDEFLSSNPGIRSRIQFNVKFENYDNKTLYEVSQSICESTGFNLPKNAQSTLDNYFNKLRAIRGDQFGNGREARNLISNAAQKLAIRLWDDKDLTVKKLTDLTESDLEKAASDILSSEIKISTKNSTKIGFH